MITIKDALQEGILTLKNTSETSIIDCEALLCFSLKINRTHLYAYPEQKLTLEQKNHYQELINNRKLGIPIAYLTGYKEFWSLKLQVSNATLIPRPDTELLVEKTLEKISNKNNAKILELGTGSGAISIALAKMRPDLQIIACDICDDALAIARNNAKLFAINNISFILSDWFTNITTKGFDAIISNPPYIAKNDPHLSQGDLRFEPSKALISGDDGLESLKHIIATSQSFLANSGFIILEHGYDQADEINKLLKLHKFDEIVCWNDLSGNDRITCGKVI